MSVDLLFDACAVSAADYYEETAPASDLRALVACRWVRVMRLHRGPGLSPIIPDGCADILVYDDTAPFAVGPDATTRSDLASGAGALHHRLLLSANIEDRLTLLEDWVRRAVARAAMVDHAVVAACRMLIVDAQTDLGAVAERFGWNARAMHRRFKVACGYGPKHVQRIMRIQRAIRLVHAGPPTRLAEAALGAGYADQAHMTRDFRDITGFTPRAYFAISRPEWGAWIDAGW